MWLRIIGFHKGGMSSGFPGRRASDHATNRGAAPAIRAADFSDPLQLVLVEKRVERPNFVGISVAEDGELDDPRHSTTHKAVVIIVLSGRLTARVKMPIIIVSIGEGL